MLLLLCPKSPFELPLRIRPVCLPCVCASECECVSKCVDGSVSLNGLRLCACVHFDRRQFSSVWLVYALHFFMHLNNKIKLANVSHTIYCFFSLSPFHSDKQKHAEQQESGRAQALDTRSLE